MLLDTESKWMWTTEYSKHHHAPCLVAAYGDHVMNKVLDQVHLTLDLAQPRIHQVVIP